MNPYISNPNDIPPTDRYADLPFYGRYLPAPEDFRVEPQHVNSHSETSLKYWESVISLCDESIQIYPADEGGRDVFALGSVIVKSSHLHLDCTETDYSYADANEVQAIAIAKSILKGVRVPEILFSGKINGRQVLVQERIPGVALSVAWQYLSQDQKEGFKEQAREILRRLYIVKPSNGTRNRSYVVQDLNIRSNGRIQILEWDMLFSENNTDLDMSFMHNDLTDSNLIVDNDKIVGVIDWEMAGFFGWRTAGKVHAKIRTPQKEHFANANVSEEKLRDIMFWNDLYDSPPE